MCLENEDCFHTKNPNFKMVDASTSLAIFNLVKEAKAQLDAAVETLEDARMLLKALDIFEVVVCY